MYSYSFWIGLIIPFGIIYIINWIIFVLIFGNLLCRPNVKKEMGNKGNLRRLKENFIIALGLSLLFGMGWAVGLLASSDLPAGVRYPAEWVFTLATAFLGVYLFVLYVIRSEEAREFWKQLLLCKKPVSGVSSGNLRTPSRTRLGTASSTLKSWSDTLSLKMLRRGSKAPTSISSTQKRNPATNASTNLYSSSSSTARMADINSSFLEPSSVIDNPTAGAESLKSPPEEIELACMYSGKEPSTTGLKSGFPSEFPVPVDVESESLVKTVSFHDDVNLMTCNLLSRQSDPQLPGTGGEDYMKESKFD